MSNSTRWFALAAMGPAASLFVFTESAAALQLPQPSGGIVVVEHQNLPDDLPRWVVGDEPVVTIGVVDGPPHPAVFGDIRAVTVRTDGVIVVADNAVSQIRAFNRTGEHLWTAGGVGQGPGEFEWRINDLFRLPGDSVLVYANGDARGTVFGPHGDVARTIPIRPVEAGGFRPTWDGVLGDGTIVGRTSESMAGVWGWTRPMEHLLFLSGSGSYEREIGALRGQERRVSQVQVPGPDGDIITATATYNLPISRRGQVAVGARSVAAGSQYEFTIAVYGATGSLRTSIQVTVPPVLTDVDRYIEFGPAESRGRRVREVELELLPDTLPRFGDVLIDSEDRVWVQEFVPPYEDRLPTWWIFDSDGDLLAQSRLPSRFTPHVIDDTEVVGVWLGPFDVPFVWILPIRR